MGEKPVVAFLGPRASYTHQATISEFAEAKFDLRPQVAIEDVFAAVQSGTAAHGVVPFENSSNGSVIFTLDLLADFQNRYPDILVEGEIYLAVHHCLLGHILRPTSSSEPRRTDLPWRRLKDDELITDDSGAATPTQETPTPAMPRVKPGYDIKHIKKLYSHPQAWGQCKLFLNTYFRGIERLDVSSTSKAAEIVAADTTKTSAAISSRIASKLNDLDLLAEGIEDNEGNSTRFFILRHQASPPLQPFPSIANQLYEPQDYKTLITFTVSHNSPGALADSLAVLKKHNLNLTNFSSRPSGEAVWHYIFFVEFNGLKKPDGQGGAVNEALEELGQVAQDWRWLGSWKNKLETNDQEHVTAFGKMSVKPS